MKMMTFLTIDKVELSGIIYKSKEDTKSIILSIHGMASSCFKKRDEIIAKQANDNGIDYFCFNNRGSEISKYIYKEINGKMEKIICGTANEDVKEGYEDILGAILKLKELGYENIHLQGHSLGATKIVYTYNRLLEKSEISNNIKSVILLSLIDIPGMLKVYLKNKYDEYVNLAKEKENAGLEDEYMPKEAFIHPISVKTFLKYTRDSEVINFANYGQDKKLEKLNNIKVPLFMRWGNVNEMIIQKPQELVEIINNTIQNQKKDINYTDGANHNYTNKEEVIAEEIIKFIISK